jgi:hypothetical protein
MVIEEHVARGGLGEYLAARLARVMILLGDVQDLGK